jgi:hypothetical protein
MTPSPPGSAPPVPPPRPAEAELPAQIQVHAPPGTLGQALAALRLRIVDGATSAWDEGCAHARAWHEQHGHLTMPNAATGPGGYPLGRWLKRQRVLRNSGQLPPARIAALDELGMTWDIPGAAWMAAWHHARAWRDEHGHTTIPEGTRAADGTCLGTWLRNQRAAWRNGTLPAARIALLEQIGVDKDAAMARWMRRYHQLTSALAEHGGQHHLPPGSPEATWLDSLTGAYRAGTLPDGKTTLLRQAGVTLDRADPWHAACQALAAFHAAHGHARVPRGTRSPAGTDLGAWATAQRTGKNQLTTSQIHLLDQIGFSWNPHHDAWNIRYHDARTYHDQHGHLPRGNHTPLSTWLYRQRRNHAAGQLTSDQEQLLHDLGALDDPAGQARP